MHSSLNLQMKKSSRIVLQRNTKEGATARRATVIRSIANDSKKEWSVESFADVLDAIIAKNQTKRKPFWVNRRRVVSPLGEMQHSKNSKEGPHSILYLRDSIT